MTTFQHFLKRTAMIMVDIIEKNNLSNDRMGAILGCGKNTIHNYRNLITTPSTDFIIKLSSYYGVNVEWLQTGIGDPYYEDGTGPREPLDERSDESGEYPLAGSATSVFSEAETVAAPKGVYGPKMDFRITSVLEKAMRLFETKSPYGDLLLENIEALDNAHTDEKEIINAQFEAGLTQAKAKSFKRQVKKTEKMPRQSKPPGKKRGAKKTRKTKTVEGATSRKTTRPKSRKSGKIGKTKKSKI